MPSFVPMLRRLTHGAFPLPQVREVVYHPQRSTVYCCSSAWRALTFERDIHHLHFKGLEGCFVQAKGWRRPSRRNASISRPIRSFQITGL
jgi:hypothetical protein